MAAPNLIALTTWKINTAIQVATTTMTDITWPIPSATSVPTGHAYECRSIICANKHATIAAKITVVAQKGGTDFEIAPSIRVSPGQNINVILGGVYNLSEGDKIRIKADTASAFVVHIPHADVN